MNILINSFCHKDYETGQSNEVAIYKDRIEIYNPEAFPEGYEPQDFIDRPERPSVEILELQGYCIIRKMLKVLEQG
jgi:hypothetical protein